MGVLSQGEYTVLFLINPFRHRLFPKHSPSRKRESLLRKRSSGEVLGCGRPAAAGCSRPASTCSPARSCSDIVRARETERSGECSTCTWVASWVHHLQRSPNDAGEAEGCARGQNLRCDLDLWLRLAQLSRLSGLAADRLAASMVAETFIRLRVLIPASAEAAVQMDRTCAIG